MLELFGGDTQSKYEALRFEMVDLVGGNTQLALKT